MNLATPIHFTHPSVGLQNGVTHDIFSAGEDSPQVLASRDEGSSA